MCRRLHGQSSAVLLMLQKFGGDRRKRNSATSGHAYGIECYHVDARFSKDLEDIGEFRGAKLAMLVFYCLEAIWCRFRYGVDNFTTCGPRQRVAIFRDWLVMFLCRRFSSESSCTARRRMARWLETVRPCPRVVSPTG